MHLLALYHISGIYDRLDPTNYQAIVECPNENCLQEITSTKHLTPHKQLRSMVQDYLNFTANLAKSGSQASDLNGIAAKNVCAQPNESQASEVYFNEHHQTKQNSFKSSVCPDNHHHDVALTNSDTTHLNYIPVLQSQTYTKCPNRINGLDYQGVEQNTYSYETHPYDNYYTEPAYVVRSDVNRYHDHYQGYGYNQVYNPIGFYNRDLTEADPNHNCEFVSSSSNTVANYYNQTTIASLPVVSTTPFFEQAPDNSVRNFNTTQSDHVHVATKRKKSYSPSSIYSRFSSSSSSDSDRNSQYRSDITDSTSKSRSRSHSCTRSDSRHFQPRSSNNNNDRQQQHKKSRDNGSSTSRYKSANVQSHISAYEKRQKANRQANDNFRLDRSRRSEKHTDPVVKRMNTRHVHSAHKMSSYEKNNPDRSKSVSRSNKKNYADTNNTKHGQTKRHHSNQTYCETERQHDRDKRFQNMHKADKHVRSHEDKNRVSHEFDIPKRVPSTSSVDKPKFR